MNRLYSIHNPVVRDTDRTMIAHRPMTGKAMPEYVTLTIPAFSVEEFTWPTPSIIVTEFRYTTTVPFSILKPIIAPTSPSYCLAIRWVDDEDAVHRYKLWSGVGEILYYPLYNSELIPAGEFAIEVWTVATSTTISSSEEYVLTTTLASTALGVDDNSCICSCERSEGANIDLTETCEIFQRMPDRAPLPFTFDTCLGSIPTGYKFTLTWGASPADLDIHIRASISGVSYHVWYAAQGDWATTPFIGLDRDDQDGGGPESIIIGNLQNPGTYLIYVHNYSAFEGQPGDLWTSGAELKVYDRKNTLLSTINVPLSGAGTYWNVLTLINGVFATVNAIQLTEPTI